MNNRQKNNINDKVVSDSLLRAAKALRVIWFTGIICVSVAIFFIYKPSAVSSYVNSQFASDNNLREEAKSIDQLLLSSEEALLADKKSFVNGALRFQWRNQEPDLNQDNNRTLLYDNILRKKLQKIPRSRVSDFSVRPIPQ